MRANQVDTRLDPRDHSVLSYSGTAHMTLTTRVCALVFAIVSVFTVFIWFSYAPLQDFPEWIYQGYIFDWLINGHITELFHLKLYPVPYTAVQLYISALLSVASPLITSKLVAATYLAMSGWASSRLIKNYQLEATLAWPFLVCVFVLNGTFWNGYVAYQFGLCLFVLYLALPLKWKTDPGVLIGGSVLAFFSHGMIYFSFILVSAIFCVVQRRHWRFVLSIIPSSLLVLWYVHDNVSVAVGGLPVMIRGVVDFVAYKLYTLMKAGPYHYFSIPGMAPSNGLHSPGAVAGSLCNFLFIAGFMVLLMIQALRRKHSDLLKSSEFIAGCALLLLALALKPIVFGVGNPAERIMYPAFIAFATLALQPVSLAKHPKGIRLAQGSVSLALIGGFLLSSFGLVVAGRLYHSQSAEITDSETLSAAQDTERTLFAHRIVQFDARMKEIQREWISRESPVMPIEFETGLISKPQ